jgi:hypothetical protein
MAFDFLFIYLTPRLQRKRGALVGYDYDNGRSHPLRNSRRNSPQRPQPGTTDQVE